jgi:hypothetical protein
MVIGQSGQSCKMKYYICEITNPENEVCQFLFDENNLQIPFSESNSDYREYQEWLAEGNTPEEWNPEQMSEEQ